MKKSDLKEGASFYVQNANGKEPSIFGGTVVGKVTQDEDGMVRFNAKDACSGAIVPMFCVIQGKTGDVLHAFSFRPLEPTIRDAFIDGMEEIALDTARAENLLESVKERQETWMSGREFPSNPESDGKSLLKPMRR